MSIRYPQRWYKCAMCQESPQHAVAGNRLLSRWDVMRLPTDHPPVYSWRCTAHRHYKMRPASAIWANDYGDLCFRLVCGHQVQWVFREEWGYTQAMIERGLAARELKLERRQRCYQCGDLEQEREAQP
jgi:hypothetical protein